MNQKVNFEKISVHPGPEKSPGFLLWKISTAWRSALEAILKEFGLTHPQFVILASLGWLTREGDLVTQAIVGKMAGLDPNTTSQIIRGLEQKELIIRLGSDDARIKNPRLTVKGRKILSLALPAVERQDAAFFDRLTPQELDHLIKIFQKLIKRPSH